MKFHGFTSKPISLNDITPNFFAIIFNLIFFFTLFFSSDLGIDDMYFQIEPEEVIAGHILHLYSAKIASHVKGEASFSVNLEQESDEGAVYIHNSIPGISNVHGLNYEKRIDALYLDPSVSDKAYRMESYRSQGVLLSNAVRAQLRCYFIKKCQFVNATAAGKGQLQEHDLMDIRTVSDATFLAKATPSTLELYQAVIRAVLQRTGPVIELVENSEGTHHYRQHQSGSFSSSSFAIKTKRIIIGYRQKSTQEYFSALSDLYHYYRLYSTRKYVENFANGVTIVCLYLAPLSANPSYGNNEDTRRAGDSGENIFNDIPSIEHSIIQVMKEASLLFCLPRTPLQEYFQTGRLSVQETIYGYAGLVFAQHFLNRLGSEYVSLASILDPKTTHCMLKS